MTSADQATIQHMRVEDFGGQLRRFFRAIGNDQYRKNNIELRDKNFSIHGATVKLDAPISVSFRSSNLVHKEFWNTQVQHLLVAGLRHETHDVLPTVYLGRVPHSGMGGNASAYHGPVNKLLVSYDSCASCDCSLQPKKNPISAVFHLLSAHLRADLQTALRLLVETRVLLSLLRRRISWRLQTSGLVLFPASSPSQNLVAFSSGCERPASPCRQLIARYTRSFLFSCARPLTMPSRIVRAWPRGVERPIRHGALFHANSEATAT